MTVPHKHMSTLASWVGMLLSVLLASVPGSGAEALVAGPHASRLLSSAPAMQPGGETFYGGYRTVEGVEAYMDREVSKNPMLAEKVDIGDSWCKAHRPCAQPEPGFDGFDLLALHITNREIPGPKPVFWFDAGLHANEIVPPELALRFISWLLDNYATDADARWLVDYHDIWVMPLANPDAHHIVEVGGDQPYLQRKNADSDDGCTVYPPVIATNDVRMLGTDLNRNFPFKWACCNGASNEPCSQVFRGPSAASEEETQAITAKLRSLIPDQRGPGDNDASPITAMGIVQSMHSIAKVNLYPWSYSPERAPNRIALDNIAAHISSRNAGGNGYRYCQAGAPGCLGGADGSSMDWVYGELGAAAVTTEIEGDDFVAPYSQVEGVWNNNRGSLLYMAKIARTPYLLARGPDSGSVAVEPQVVNVGSKPRLLATINSSWIGNNYEQAIGGAEYYLDMPPWAGGTPLPMDPIDGKFDAATELVQVVVDTGALLPGRHMIFVRGRGVNTYDANGSWGPVSAAFLDVVQSGGTPVAGATPNPSPTVVARTPLPPPLPLPGSESRTYPETGKTATGIFLNYWDRNGGLAQQGFPISDVLGEVSDLDSKPYTMQYFERAVFEYHPENKGTPYEVLLSQLGTFRYRHKYPNGAPNQTPNTSEGSVLFPQTGKRVGGLFLDYWNKNGGLAQQGYPISEEFAEVSELDGKSYRVQYFERAVFEFHPEIADPKYKVLLSQLGTFRHRSQYPLP